MAAGHLFPEGDAGALGEDGEGVAAVVSADILREGLEALLAKALVVAQVVEDAGKDKFRDAVLATQARTGQRVLDGIARCAGLLQVAGPSAKSPRRPEILWELAVRGLEKRP